MPASMTAKSLVASRGFRSTTRATRTADGPATVALRPVLGGVEAEAWGPGADRALDAVPALVGADDDGSGFEPRHHPLVADLARHRLGIRIGRTGAVMEALVPAILEQKVTGTEAWRGMRGLIRGWGEPAPGPFGLRLGWVQPGENRPDTLPDDWARSMWLSNRDLVRLSVARIEGDRRPVSA